MRGGCRARIGYVPRVSFSSPLLAITIPDMIAVIQRVAAAKVIVDGRTVGAINRGLCILCAVQKDDTDRDLQWMADKIATMRVFPEGDKNFHLDVRQAGAAVLLISNFTVAAITNTGRRPTLERAADPESARTIFEKLLARVAELGVPVQTGKFREHMDVTIENDGPITFIVDSRAE
jgi:D-aminoacyl-tRNA deacylase